MARGVALGLPVQEQQAGGLLKRARNPPEMGLGPLGPNTFPGGLPAGSLGQGLREAAAQILFWITEVEISASSL